LRKILIGFFIILNVILCSGCFAPTNPEKLSALSGNGNLKIIVIDSSFLEFESMVIKVKEIAIGSDEVDEKNWQIVDTNEYIIDLLKLRNGVVFTFDTKQIPVGHFNRLKIKIESCYAKKGSSLVELKIPEKDKNGILVLVDFDINEFETTELILDFNLVKSVRLNNGNFSFSPVIYANLKRLCGAIEGVVLHSDGKSPENIVVKVMSSTAKDAYEITRTSPDLHGKFRFPYLPYGAYTFYFESSGYETQIISNVSVKPQVLNELNKVILSLK